MNLIHLPLDKMATILADNTFKCIFLHEKDRILIGIALKFVPKGLIDNNSALVEVMDWWRTGNKPLPEPNADTVHWRIHVALGGDELIFNRWTEFLGLWESEKNKE